MDKNYDNELALRCREGLSVKYGEDVTKELCERLSYELSAIKDIGAASYMLHGSDLISMLRKHSYWVGPGSGSMPGSLVNFLLGITEVDPMKYGLLFERFINLPGHRIAPIEIETTMEGYEYLLALMDVNRQEGIGFPWKITASVYDECYLTTDTNLDASARGNLKILDFNKENNELINKLRTNFPNLFEDTRGILTYQEQVINIISRMKGCSLAEAVNTRRDIALCCGNSPVAEKEEYIKKAQGNGFDAEFSGQVYDLISDGIYVLPLKAHVLSRVIAAQSYKQYKRAIKENRM